MLKTLHISYDRSHISYARANRKDPTLWEQVMRNILKTKPCWYKFTRQKPLWPYIADFYCSKLLLVIEVDGLCHEDKINYDHTRDNYLGKMCIKTIRYENEFLKINPDIIYDDIIRQIDIRRWEVSDHMICSVS